MFLQSIQPPVFHLQKGAPWLTCTDSSWQSLLGSLKGWPVDLYGRGKMAIFSNGHQIVRATMINQGFGMHNFLTSRKQFSPKPISFCQPSQQVQKNISDLCVLAESQNPISNSTFSGTKVVERLLSQECRALRILRNTRRYSFRHQRSPQDLRPASWWRSVGDPPVSSDPVATAQKSLCCSNWISWYGGIGSLLDGSWHPLSPRSRGHSF